MVQSEYQQRVHSGLEFGRSPFEEFGATSIGAVVALPGDSDQLLACSIDSRWANSTATVLFLGGPLLASRMPTDWFL